MELSDKVKASIVGGSKTGQGECPRLEYRFRRLKIGGLKRRKFQVKPSKIKVKNYYMQDAYI